MLERKEKSLFGQDASRDSSREGTSQELSREPSSKAQMPRQSQHANYPMAQMDRLFDEIFKRPFFSLWSHRLGGQEVEESLYIPVDIYEDGESVVVKAEMPGMRKEDINVQLAPDTITISGEKRTESKVEKDDYFRMESSTGSFTRTCQLPAETLTDKARAVFKDGVLEVRIPKSMESRQRGRALNIE